MVCLVQTKPYGSTRDDYSVGGCTLFFKHTLALLIMVYKTNKMVQIVKQTDSWCISRSERVCNITKIAAELNGISITNDWSKVSITSIISFKIYYHVISYLFHKFSICLIYMPRCYCDLSSASARQN